MYLGVIRLILTSGKPRASIAVSAAGLYVTVAVAFACPAARCHPARVAGAQRVNRDGAALPARAGTGTSVAALVGRCR